MLFSVELLIGYHVHALLISDVITSYKNSKKILLLSKVMNLSDSKEIKVVTLSSKFITKQ